MLDVGASDLHLTAGTPALVRVHGDLAPLRDCPTLPPDLIQRLLYTILTQKQRERFEATSSSTSPTRCRAPRASA